MSRPGQDRVFLSFLIFIHLFTEMNDQLHLEWYYDIMRIGKQSELNVLKDFKAVFVSWSLSVFKDVSWTSEIHHSYSKNTESVTVNEPRFVKTGCLHMRQQRRRSAVQ